LTILLTHRNTECHYSYAAKLGKPKGSLNKKTLAKLASASTGNFNLTMDTTKDRIQQHQEDLEQHTHTFSSESDNNMGFPPPQPIDPEVMGILDWQSLLRSLDGDSVGVIQSFPPLLPLSVARRRKTN